MPSIITTCIVLYNLFIVKNKGIENESIGIEKKITRRVTDGKKNEIQEEKTKFAEMREIILARKDVPIADEVNDI